MTTPQKNALTETPTSTAKEAEAHFSSLLELETDCWDTHEALARSKPGFVLIDVRGPEAYESGHIEGAISLPHGRLIERNLSEYPTDTLFVVYCAGPHCNGADKGALRLARLGRPVKKMIGGVEGWIDEGFDLVGSNRAILARFGDAWMARDRDALARCLASDCWYSPSVADPPGAVSRGREAVLATITEMWGHDAGSKAEFGPIIEKGDTIVRTWRYRFGDGRTADGIDVFTFSGGLIVGKDAYRKIAS